MRSSRKNIKLDPEFAGDIRRIRVGHGSFRVNLALKGLPAIRFAFPPARRAPDIEGQEAKYFAANAGRLPEEPRLEITIPSIVDDSLAPPDHHIMTAPAQ